MKSRKTLKRFVPKKYPSGRPVPKHLQKSILNKLVRIEKDNHKLRQDIKKIRRVKK